jgi:two-component system, cell cycle response regulator
MNELPQRLLSSLVKINPDGIVVCERGGEGWIVRFVNPAFEKLTGYRSQELIGRDLRFLQGEDREQESRQRIREALAEGSSCRVLMKNYRNDASVFWNEFTLAPITDSSGNVTHYVGFHRDASERQRLDPKNAGVRETPNAGSSSPPSLLSVLRDDRLTGLYSRAYFDDLYRRDFAVAQREGRRLAVFVLDVDALGAYNDTFGKAAGDSCLKRVARTVAGCFRRGSDLIARLDGGTLVAMVHGMTPEQLLPFANSVLERVREARIHHPKSSIFRYVTVSAGVLSQVPAAEEKPEYLLEKAHVALKDAKAGGRNRVVVAR